MKPFYFLGPCVVESYASVMQIAEKVAYFSRVHDVKVILKASFDKANRTSMSSFRGIPMEEALQILQHAGNTYNLETITDVHSVDQVDMARKYTVWLQIPAFLSRQTDLLTAVGEANRKVHVKKAQWMSGLDMQHVVDKIRKVSPSDHIYVCERGTSFGYHNNVVDFRNLAEMKSLEGIAGVTFDCTHSTQRPSSNGKTSGGDRQYSRMLARAAIATHCVDGIFAECHYDPDNALSDPATSLPLSEVDLLIRDTVALMPEITKVPVI